MNAKGERASLGNCGWLIQVARYICPVRASPEDDCFVFLHKAEATVPG